ncbi:MAG: regulatory protein RecX [Bacteroidaceae bacterium]
MKELTEKEALYKAAAYCSTAEHCLSEVASKLADWGQSAEAVESILTRLVREGFIDEVRYARSFVREKFGCNRWGRIKIRQALRQKGIPSSFGAEALSEIDEQEYLSVLRALLEAKRRSVRANTAYEAKAKLVRFAVGRGFEMEAAFACLGGDDDEAC